MSKYKWIVWVGGVDDYYVHYADAKRDYDNWIEYIEDRPFNDKRYYIRNNKLKELGWNIEISFNDGIEVIIN